MARLEQGERRTGKSGALPQLDLRDQIKLCLEISKDVNLIYPNRGHKLAIPSTEEVERLAEPARLRTQQEQGRMERTLLDAVDPDADKAASDDRNVAWDLQNTVNRVTASTPSY